MIVDKEQIKKICILAEEISEKIKNNLTDDEMRFFEGFVLFNMKGTEYKSVRINDRGNLWVDGYTCNYEDFVNRNIKYINNIHVVDIRAENAIKEAKEGYKKSLEEGGIAIQKLREIKNNL